MKRSPTKITQLKPGRIIQLKVELLDVTPTVWRRIQVPGWYTLEHLHEVIQRSMGWMAQHDYRFTIDGAEYVEFRGRWRENPETEDTMFARLDKVISKEAMLYEYDFGDGWKHTLTFERFLEVDPACMYPICIGGENACPPESCGGPGGYVDLLGKLSDPADPEHEDARSWVGGYFDPKGFDTNTLNRLFLWPREDLPLSEDESST